MLPFLDQRELAGEDRDQEIAVTARRLKEPRIYVGEHVRDEVEHNVDLALVRVDLG